MLFNITCPAPGVGTSGTPEAPGSPLTETRSADPLPPRWLLASLPARTDSAAVRNVARLEATLLVSLFAFERLALEGAGAGALVDGSGAWFELAAGMP